jgi:hypothetical protein
MCPTALSDICKVLFEKKLSLEDEPGMFVYPVTVDLISQCTLNSVENCAPMVSDVPVTTARRVLRLRLEERLPDMEGYCEYIEYAVADNQQWVVLQLECWARC